MQREIMIGEIPLVITENNGENSVQLVNPSARQTTGLGLSIENSQEVSTAGQAELETTSRRKGKGKRPRENSPEEIPGAGQAEPESSSGQKGKDKRSNRHSKPQIDALEEFFNSCPNPDATQRQHLSEELGMQLKQVKFWFQNKRKQTEVQQDHNENKLLRVENEKLRDEVVKCKRDLSENNCHKCGEQACMKPISIGEDQLLQENKSLKKQIEEMKFLIAKYAGKEHLESLVNPNSNDVTQKAMSGQYKCLIEFLKANEPLVKDLTMTSMKELIKKINREDIWMPDTDGRGYVLKMEEYFKVLTKGFRFHSNPKGWKTEASMESADVIMTPVNVVDVFMNLDKWLSVYSSFVSEATNFHQLSIGRDGIQDGAIQLIYAEFHTPCPIVPIRESFFLRYCKQQDAETWFIADVSLDTLFPSSLDVPSSKCLRWPSGCIIKERPNGRSKVTWVEHVVADDQDVHILAKPVLQSGVVYGARRWVSVLERQSERLALTSHQHINEIHSLSLLKLSEIILHRFYGGATASNEYGWIYVSGDGVDEVKIMKRDAAKEPMVNIAGTVVCASLSLFLPLRPQFVFDFIRNQATRHEWDILCADGIAHETIHVATGRGTGNCVTVLQVMENDGDGKEMIIQDSSTDQVLSSFIYAPVGVESMTTLLSDTSSGGSRMLPRGFTMLPSPLPPTGVVGNFESFSMGCLLTASFQHLIYPQDYPESWDTLIEMVESIVQNDVNNIKKALMPRNIV